MKDGIGVLDRERVRDRVLDRVKDEGWGEG